MKHSENTRNKQINRSKKIICRTYVLHSCDTKQPNDVPTITCQVPLFKSSEKSSTNNLKDMKTSLPFQSVQLLFYNLSNILVVHRPFTLFLRFQGINCNFNHIILIILNQTETTTFLMNKFSNPYRKKKKHPLPHVTLCN